MKASKTSDVCLKNPFGVEQVCVEGEILSAEWLDNGKKIEALDNVFLSHRSYTAKAIMFVWQN